MITIRNQYYKTAAYIYVTVFLLGMGNIILSSNMDSLTQQLNTEASGISYIITAFGIGRLLTYALTGFLSDKLGRKPMIILAALLMAIFFIGIPLTQSTTLAFFLALTYGIGNSFLDSGVYPALSESFPKSAGTANVLVKAFISIGAILLPIFIHFLVTNDFFYGWSFFVPAIIAILMVFLLLPASFPEHKGNRLGGNQLEELRFSSEPMLRIEGFALIFIGFTAMSLITIMQIWLPTLGQEIYHMTSGESISLLSYYSFGSLVSVVMLAFLLKKVLPVTILVIYPIITVISIICLLSFDHIGMAVVFSFFVGLSIGGVFQLAITVLTELFWHKKGIFTGFISTAGSLGATLMPIVTGVFSSHFHVTVIFIFTGFISVLGVASAMIVNYRYRKLTAKPILLEDQVNVY